MVDVSHIHESDAVAMTQPLHVIVIGGGIGGLSLANGLRKAGLAVHVFERDRTPADRLQGYEIHLTPFGSHALHDLLPADLWDAFVASAGPPIKGTNFLTEQLKQVAYIPRADADGTGDAVGRSRSASRITMRQILLAGLPDRVSFGKTFVRYDLTSDGRVTASFEDGANVTGDVLVAADGSGSAGTPAVPTRRRARRHRDPGDRRSSPAGGTGARAGASLPA